MSVVLRKEEVRDVPVEISPEAMLAIRAASEGPIAEKYCRLLPNGNWRVMFSERVHKRLRTHALAGESISDTLVRVMSTKPRDGATRRRR